MHFLKTIGCFMLLSICVQNIYAQEQQPVDAPDTHLLFGNTQYIQTDTGLIIRRYYRHSCKSHFVKSEFRGDSIMVPYKRITKAVTESPKDKFLVVHGNVLYNFFYRSLIDTPFTEKNVMQHLVQTNLSVLIKDKYPVHLTLSSRNSNSDFFRDKIDVNVQFSRSYLLENIKNNFKERANQLMNLEPLTASENLYKQQLNTVVQLKDWINNPATIQQLVEEKENMIRNSVGTNSVISYADKLQSLDGLKNYFGNGFEKKFAQKGVSGAIDDLIQSKFGKNAPTDSNFLKKYNSKKEELTKLEKEIRKSSEKLNKLKRGMQDSVNNLKKEINGLKTGSGLYAFMKKNGINDNEISKGQKLLLSVNQIGIGRTFVDYSELTVKNLSLSGVNIEANPSPIYFAFAAGKVNYRFRDFILNKNNALPDQSLYLFRAGIGGKEKNNLIFTFYNGKKSILNYTPSNNSSSVQPVLGISAEARLALNENNYLVAEIAKSSFQNAGGSPPVSGLIGKAFNLKIHSNEAYSVKLFSQYPRTGTKFSAWYRKTGENFQSFNLYPINVNYDAYAFKVSQYFLKKKIAVDAAIRKNDFVSPVAAPSFSSQTVFKSIQASVRIKKLPFISVGYYPTSQLSVGNNNLLMENQYNTLNSIVSYSYEVKKTNMNTNVVFTKFYNSSSDTGFIYFNASSYTINQSVNILPFTLQGNFSLTEQKGLHLITLEPLVSYQHKNIFNVGGSFKWNRLNYIQTLLGGTATLSLYLKKLGTIQLNYDKTYLPGYNSILNPVDIGRASFYRVF